MTFYRVEKQLALHAIWRIIISQMALIYKAVRSFAKCQLYQKKQNGLCKENTRLKNCLASRLLII